MTRSFATARGILRGALILGLVASWLVPTAAARTWLNKKTATRFQAEFVRVKDGKVVFTRAGRTQVVPLEDLIEQDQEYIRQELTSRGKPWLAAPPDALRTWTDSQGHTNAGMFVRMQGRDVVLGNTKGLFSYPFELLSPDDQDFVRRELTAQGKSDQIPSDNPEETSAKRLAKEAEAKGKPESREAVSGVVGGRSFDSDMAGEGSPPKPAPPAGEKTAPAPPSTPSPQDSIASVTPSAPPVPPDKAPEKKEKDPDEAKTGPGALSPPDKPASALAPPSAQPAEPAKPAAAGAAAAKPATAPAKPATPAEPQDYSYCSRCKHAYPGLAPGDPCGGCGAPLDMLQKPDGTLVDAPGQSFWEKWGLWIIVGSVCVVGAVGYLSWKGGQEGGSD